ncbi:corrinoid adenosyltransferase MMAB-like [Macrosteles quadrilineatus]|uniref:corrinoid adenosyltransferase MMAB-like n=1 Tax=Macrosteles quadrilineatus TaxID=74068 RepID=UPI0023E12D2F|nr:corrinoid adenosyltransferase MMAB-like [Macrosteles quadrilineatus]XP_054289618.1 corrinoid adenosyltransferase MMAB-like [Macrosteles quadrilineatus]
MEALSKLKNFVPTGIRYLSARYSTSKVEPPQSNELPGENNESHPPFSREGDSGFSTINEVSLPKNDRIFDAIGNTDELSCYLGLARENAIVSQHPYTDKLTRIQTMLVDIVLAISKQTNKATFSSQNTKELEEWIVLYSKDLTPAENYLLPGGGKTSTSLHVARSICRRAERSVQPLVQDGRLDKEIQVYFNRLADLLFTWARYAAKKDERSESVYTPRSEMKKKTEAKQENNDSNNIQTS